jgi:hypothetical protein
MISVAIFFVCVSLYSASLGSGMRTHGLFRRVEAKIIFFGELISVACGEYATRSKKGEKNEFVLKKLTPVVSPVVS